MSSNPVLAVIPARGGSLGIPAKNLQPVGGVPLVGRAVRAAMHAERIDRVVVSTDDPEIAAVARAHGAEVLERPAELSTSTATSESALLHVLDQLVAAGDSDPEICVLVQCTSPFVSPADLDGVVDVLTSDGADCSFTVTGHHGFLWRPAAGGVEAVNHDARARTRRQDLAPEYLETGAAYAMRVVGFREHGHRFFGRLAVHAVPGERAIEIDDHADLILARTMVATVDRSDAAASLPDPVEAIVFDFDGVLTDNKVVTDHDGVESVRCDRSDGMGIGALRAAGVPMLVISKERNPVVARRCEKLGLEVVQGVDEKWPVLVKWLDGRSIDPAQVVYVGNDTNDVECLDGVGCGVVVADAHPGVRDHGAIVLTRPGGSGAVRELADLVIARRSASR
jgi:YrbI family 3-deoxy-D-manno-octulosonate 8-phosphate phosphatase